MKNLSKFLSKKKYTKINLSFTKTNHFEIKAVINGVKGVFILDTGASSSCVGFEHEQHFKLSSEESEVKATGAGASNLNTAISKKNLLKIGKWKNKKFDLILFDLSHVNEGLKNHDATPVHGIIGADVLKKGKAIIDYENKVLYLKG